MCAFWHQCTIEMLKWHMFSQVRSRHSSSSSTCANGSSCWDGAGDEGDVCNLLSIPVATPENLYLMGKSQHTAELMRPPLCRWTHRLNRHIVVLPQEWSCSRRPCDAGNRHWRSAAGKRRMRRAVRRSSWELEMPSQKKAWRYYSPTTVGLSGDAWYPAYFELQK